MLHVTKKHNMKENEKKGCGEAANGSAHDGNCDFFTSPHVSRLNVENTNELRVHFFVLLQHSSTLTS